MPAAATDILSVSDARAQLRIDEDDKSNNAIIQEAIESAVDFVDNSLTVPLLDTTCDLELPYPCDSESPLSLQVEFVEAVTSVKYWSNGTGGSFDPDNTVATADLGRVVKRHNMKFKEAFITHVYPPKGGWKEWNVSVQTPFTASVKLGIAVVPKTIRQAIITIVRRMYDGYWETDSMRGVPDYRNLIMGYESWLQ